MSVAKKKYSIFVTDFWSDARVAEEARLESVYASKAHRGFESPSLRQEPLGMRTIGFVIGLPLSQKESPLLRNYIFYCKEL